jgi:hypothetical protein
MVHLELPGSVPGDSVSRYTSRFTSIGTRRTLRANPGVHTSVTVTGSVSPGVSLASGTTGTRMPNVSACTAGICCAPATDADVMRQNNR